MKLIRSLLLIITILLCLFNMSTTCSMHYSLDELDGFVIGYAPSDDRAFVGSFDYTIGDNSTITLPSEYEGIPIKQLGGYMGRGYPCPFSINITDLEKMANEQNASILYAYMDELEERIANGEEFIYNDIVFYITLPPELDEISNNRSDAIHILESLNGEKLEKPVVYRTLMYFTIDSSNKTFYTEDGRLYYKKTGKLVDEFLYE